MEKNSIFKYLFLFFGLTLCGSLVVLLYLYFSLNSHQGESYTLLRSLFFLLALLLFFIKSLSMKKDVKRGRIL